MADENIPRRRFLQGAGAVATALGTTLNAERNPCYPRNVPPQRNSAMSRC